MTFTKYVLLLIALSTAVFGYSGTSLDDYVNTPDSVYSWQVIGSNHTNASPFGYTVHKLRMTSQTWQTPAFSDHYVWNHTLYVCVPDVVLYTQGFMVIVAGSDTSDGTDAQDAAIYVCRTGGIGASLHQIPQQPIKFYDTAPLRDGDEIIAYTFRRFLNSSGSDPTQLIFFPMVKAAKRALDTIQAFAATLNKPITGFTVGGISKRGWTSWLLGAVDERVTSIIPINIGNLNSDNTIPNVYRSLGEWGFALGPYTAQRIFDFIGLPINDKLNQQVDPISYNDRYVNKVKLIVCASFDQFFTLDSTRNFYSLLKGPKYLTIIPNADHSFIVPGSAEKLINLVLAWYQLTAQGATLPTLTWTLKYANYSNAPASIEVTTNSYAQVGSAKQWTVSTTRPGFRDFRLQNCANISLTSLQCWNYVLNGVMYTNTSLTPQVLADNKAKYEAVLTTYPPPSQQRWTGFFVEITYNLAIRFPGIGLLPVSLPLTSEANIFPDFYPFTFTPNYDAIGYPPQRVCSVRGGVTFTATKDGQWNDGTYDYTQWSVALSANVDLYSVHFLISNANVVNIWNAELVSGNEYRLPVYAYNNGKIPAGSTVSFGYITRSLNSGDFSLANNACAPPSSPSCSVTVSAVVTNTWSSDSATFQRVDLVVSNTGSVVAANTRVDFSFASNAVIDSSWNMDQISNSSYTCRLYNLYPGSTSSSCGYIARGAVSVSSFSPVCIL